MVMPFEEAFPRLAQGSYTITSPYDKRYNCIAYAAGDTGNWWWPLPTDVKEVFWPAGITRAETLAAFHELFASLGFSEWTAEDADSGFEKIALFANDDALPLHSAWQLPSGRWASKLGECEDIEHELHDLEGEAYGTVVMLMKRQVAAGPTNGS
jgi:hypothetical protein